MILTIPPKSECLNMHIGLKHPPACQLIQTVGQDLAASTCRNGHALPYENIKTTYKNHLQMIIQFC